MLEVRIMIFVIVLIISNIDSAKLYHHQQKVLNLTDINFEYKHLNEVCKQRLKLCDKLPDAKSVCALRYLNETVEYKSFDNTCSLFLANLCEFSDGEFHIIHGGYCDEELSSRKLKRRLNEKHTAVASESHANGSSRIEINRTFVLNETNTYENDNLNISKLVLRSKTKKMRYDIDETFDDHKCPYFCPDAYSPVCMSVNRGEGKYFKYFTFINHCYGDMYYCKHYEDLGPAPMREYEDVQVSPLGWSFCGAFRYLQFARYSEVLSSMGHYGWLAGDYRYSHIMEPHQRMPGYG